MKKRTLLCSAALFALTLAPLSSIAMAGAEDGQLVSGTVLETMNSGGYTYMNVSNDTGETAWVAIPESTVTKGEKVTFYNGMVMKNFPSKTLNRTFEAIIFSAGLAGADTSFHGGGSPHKAAAPTGAAKDSFAAAVAKENSHPAAPAAMGQSSGGSSAAIVPFENLKVAKADGENAITVGEAFDKAAELDGKTVRIRGKVLKVSNQIMGRNWVHLQDGTGDPMQNHHDLVATTTETVQPGTEVVAEGVLAAQKDFGAGYRYDAIVEKATFKAVK